MFPFASRRSIFRFLLRFGYIDLCPPESSMPFPAFPIGFKKIIWRRKIAAFPSHTLLMYDISTFTNEREEENAVFLSAQNPINYVRRTESRREDFFPSFINGNPLKIFVMHPIKINLINCGWTGRRAWLIRRISVRRPQTGATPKKWTRCQI